MKNQNTYRLNVLLLCTGMIFHSFSAKAQETDKQDNILMESNLPSLTLEQAREKALKSYPKIQAKRLNIEKQKALKKTAWDLGQTKVYTGKEEVGNSEMGIHTLIGIQQQQIDIFGIASKLKLQNEYVVQAENTLELSKLELKKKLSVAWGNLYTAKKTLEIYEKLDSLFQKIKIATEKKLEVEAISQLEYMATTNQANKMTIEKGQAYSDYLIVLQQFNRWFVSDTIFTAAAIATQDLGILFNPFNDSLTAHPLLNIAGQRVEIADAIRRKENSNFLPKLEGQYGWQEIAGQSGYYKFEIGINIPLFFLPELGKKQAAKIGQKIAQQNLLQTQIGLQAVYQMKQNQYFKWKDTWIYYRDKAVPLAKKQQNAAVKAYQKGAVDYVGFLQNIRDAVQMEVDAWDAFGKYLNRSYELEFYNKYQMDIKNSLK